MIGAFGAEKVRVPRARLVREDGGTAEWRSKALRRYQRLTRRAEAMIKTQTVLPEAEVRADAVLGALGLRPDRHAQGRRL